MQSQLGQFCIQNLKARVLFTLEGNKTLHKTNTHTFNRIKNLKFHHNWFLLIAWLIN